MIEAMHDTLRQRFDAKWQLDPETGCWLWTAGCMSRGYGVIRVHEGDKWRMELAHRVAWKLYRGPIPAGLNVLHHCDRPACVNPLDPDHLFLGTNAENSADMVAKQRQATGERNGQARLTEEEAKAVLALRGTGETQVDVAARFGISASQVAFIWRGKRWSHLQEEVAA